MKIIFSPFTFQPNLNIVETSGKDVFAVFLSTTFCCVVQKESTSFTGENVATDKSNPGKTIWW